jgi:hypothetical protein
MPIMCLGGVRSRMWLPKLDLAPIVRGASAVAVLAGEMPRQLHGPGKSPVD